MATTYTFQNGRVVATTTPSTSKPASKATTMSSNGFQVSSSNGTSSSLKDAYNKAAADLQKKAAASGNTAVTSTNTVKPATTTTAKPTTTTAAKTTTVAKPATTTAAAKPAAKAATTTAKPTATTTAKAATPTTASTTKAAAPAATTTAKTTTPAAASTPAKTATSTPATSSNTATKTATKTTATAKNTTTPAAATTPTYTPTGLYDPATLEAYNRQREADLRALYDAALQNTLAGYRTAYDQNLSDSQAARDQIAPQYQQSMNSLSSEYERQRRNNNMQAAMNGLNSGAGSQMALAQSANYQANQANLAQRENEAINDANRRIGDLQRNYQNAIAQATANNNYKLAAAMLDEYQNAYNRQLNLENTNYNRAMQADQQAYQRAYNEENRDYTRAYNEDQQAYQRAFNADQQAYQRAYNEEQQAYQRRMNEAQTRASYGDFSGYRDIYGDETANAMETMWAAKNPAAAWMSGKLSAEDYYAITGQYPVQNGQQTTSGNYGSTGGMATGSAGTAARTSAGGSNGTSWYGARFQELMNQPGAVVQGFTAAEGETPRNLSTDEMIDLFNRARTGATITQNGVTQKINYKRPARGYSASLDTAYRGAPGYLNENGQFVTGWSNDAPAAGHEQDYAVAHAYTDGYVGSEGNRYLANLYAQDTYQDYMPGSTAPSVNGQEPTKTWSERATGK